MVREIKLAKEPAGYDPADKYADPVLYFKHREALSTEKLIEVGESKYLRAKLRACYRDNGIDHLSECRELATSYLKSIEGVGFYKANSGLKDEARWGPSQ